MADVLVRKGANGHVEPATIHGAGSVAISSESRRGNEKPVPAKLAADEVSGVFGPDSALTSMAGAGHASMEETTANGSLETATGDRLQAQFSSIPQLAAPISPLPGPAAGPTARTSEQGTPVHRAPLNKFNLPCWTATLCWSSSRLCNQTWQTSVPGRSAAAGSLRATAGRAEYEGAGEWLHLMVNPRVDDGGLQMTADKVDVAQASGDAFAHGNVKAHLDEQWRHRDNTGTNSGPDGDRRCSRWAERSCTGRQGAGSRRRRRGRAPSGHRQEATFRGHARLWQETNSVAGPTIVLDREKQTLTARSMDPAEPVSVVMLSAGGPGTTASGTIAAGTPANAGADAGSKSSAPSVIRVRGGDLWYSGIERRARMQGGALGPVAVDTGNVESTSTEAELFLTPVGNGPDSAGQSQPSAAQSQPAQSQGITHSRKWIV